VLLSGAHHADAAVAALWSAIIVKTTDDKSKAMALEIGS
jgi:hypothetical protein